MIIYVASMPQPQAAAAWADAGSPSENGVVQFKPMMVAVVVTTGDDKRLVFGFFDHIPDDDRLKSMMQEIAAGKARWLMGFNVNSRAITPNSAP